ncbi:MAG: 50S ribosomal protein L18 [Flavobacteriales bacterium]|nr:50S ribosomal protein L18 [Flavobacteriales bacterium]
MATSKVLSRLKIKKRVRSKISGTKEMPRLSVFRSNNEIYAQLIDDSEGKTLLSASSLSKGLDTGKVNKSEKSFMVGKSLAENAVANGISKVVFDRNGYLYHGRVKRLAEGAREGGLNF